MSEKETRRRLLNIAKYYGFEQELKAILNRYDLLLKNCTNQKEREAIAAMGALEIHKFLGGDGSLEVNGKTIYEIKK